MCGIVGYVGPQQAEGVVIEGLRRLEYRGYDSAGIALVHDGKIAFWTYGSSQKVKNLERDPRITCLVETGTEYFELAGVSIQGTAEIVRDEDRIREIGTNVVQAMAGGADLGELGAEIVEKQVKKRVGIVVTPTKTASWDHSKMSSLPGGGNKP